MSELVSEIAVGQVSVLCVCPLCVAHRQRLSLSPGSCGLFWLARWDGLREEEEEGKKVEGYARNCVGGRAQKKEEEETSGQAETTLSTIELGMKKSLIDV